MHLVHYGLNNMKKTFKYFYYRCYDFLCIFKSFDIYFAALHLMCIISSFVILELMCFIPQNKDELILNNKIIFGSAYIIPMIFYYFIIFRNEKYLVIIEKYKKESKTINIIGKISVALLIILLIAMLFVVKPNLY